MVTAERLGGNVRRDSGRGLGIVINHVRVCSVGEILTKLPSSGFSFIT